MRRFTPLLFIILTALALPAVALARSPRQAAATSPHQTPALLPSAALAAAHVGRATCTITGTALAYDGSAIAAADMDWGYESSGSWVYGGSAKTGSSGEFELQGVLVTPTGTLDVYPTNSNDTYGRVALNFADAATFIIRPGQVPFSTDHEAPGTPWTSVYVQTFGSGGMSATSIDGVSGQVPATAPSVDHAVAYWFINEGKEWAAPSPLAVNPGALSSGGIVIGEAGAQFISILSPTWASGAPGTKVRLEVDNWVAPMTARFSFTSENPDDAQGTYPWATPFSANASSARVVALTIPKKVTAGFGVRVHMTGTDDGTSLLDLYDRFQVCTLIAGKTAIASGAAVRLSGVVPANGLPKKVILYSRTKASGQPTKWDAAKAGWKKVATLSVAKTGAFKSALLRPSRTTWYVVRYPADTANFGAFTSVLKVTVH
jgi:hypothetical protein